MTPEISCFHCLIDPTPEDLKQLYVPGYRVVFDEPAYGFDNLSHRARKNVRRGLKNCTLQPISAKRFIAEGWALRSGTLDRQGRETGETFEIWSRGYRIAAGLEDFEFRGRRWTENSRRFCVPSVWANAST
jgi:hypothetical protein